MNLRIKSNIILFLFPFYPIKIYRNTRCIILLAVFISLGIVLSFINIKIPGFNISIGFAWSASMLAGWFFGPIVGFVIGFVIDSISFLLNGGIWFWLYAIQEPIVGLISGIISGIIYFFIRSNKFNVLLITQQIIFICFLAISYFLILFYLNRINNKNIDPNFNTIYKWILLGFILLFFIVVEIFTFLYIKKKKNQDKRNLMLFFGACLLCILITTIFSFILGPISTVEYFRYINNRDPNSFIKYGYAYYLLPRIIKELVKTPVYIILMYTLVLSTNHFFVLTYYKAINEYKIPIFKSNTSSYTIKNRPDFF